MSHSLKAELQRAELQRAELQRAELQRADYRASAAIDILSLMSHAVHHRRFDRTRLVAQLLLAAFVVSSLGCPLSRQRHERKGTAARVAAAAEQSRDRDSNEKRPEPSSKPAFKAPAAPDRHLPIAGMLFLTQPKFVSARVETPPLRRSLPVELSLTRLVPGVAPPPEPPPPRPSAG